MKNKTPLVFHSIKSIRNLNKNHKKRSYSVNNNNRSNNNNNIIINMELNQQLYNAVKYDKVEKVKILLSEGADIEWRDEVNSLTLYI